MARAVTRRAAVVVLGLGVTAVLLWWVLRDVDLYEIWRAFVLADRRWLALSVGAVVGTVAVRGIRWYLLLRDAAPRVRLRSSMLSTMLGQGANNALPAHGGEVVRAVAIARIDRVSGATALGSIGVERLLDMTTVAAMLVVALALQPPAAGGSTSFVRLVAVAVLTVVAIVAVIALLMRYGDGIGRVATTVLRRLFGDRVGHRAGRSIAALLVGATVLNTPRRLLRATTLSVALWGLNALALLCGLFAFDVDVPASAAVVLQAVLVIGIVLPAAPGFFGPFEAAAILALGWYGVTAQDAAAYILPVHVVAYFLPVLALGSAALVITGLDVTEVTDDRVLADPPTAEAGDHHAL